MKLISFIIICLLSNNSFAEQGHIYWIKTYNKTNKSDQSLCLFSKTKNNFTFTISIGTKKIGLLFKQNF